MTEAGAVLFGVVIGWVTYRTLRRSQAAVGLSDIATVIGAVGGGFVVQQFNDGAVFGFYALGLAVGFFGYLGLALVLEGRKVAGWMGTQTDSPSDDRWG